MESGLSGIKLISDIPLQGKKTFIRLDLNVPMQKGRITDDTRIQAALPTIRYALDQGAKVILASHLGRPKGPEEFSKYSLEPVGARLAELLNREVHLVAEPTGDAPKGLFSGHHKDMIILLENLRFDYGEEENSLEFANHLASISEVYINDAFGASHRAHASISALPSLIKDKAVGFLIKKEIEMLDKLLVSPATPYVAILGGAKVSDKIGVIENLMDRIDTFIIGGAMAYTFLAALEIPVGASRVEKDKVKFAKELLLRIEARDKQILLPIDHVVANSFENPSKVETTADQKIPEGMMGLDIGPKTCELYRKALEGSKTVFWNGPMGVFEKSPFEKGTFKVAEILSKLTALTIVGGGDSAAAVKAAKLEDKMTHISTGGGASLEYLQGDKLPGLEILRTRRYA